MEKPPVNHGEGNPEAAAEFNEAERGFVASEQGKRKIEQGPQVGRDEQEDLERAEQRGKSHAKNDDSNTDQMKSKH